MVESDAMGNDELELVEWLRPRQRGHPAVGLGIGDDMAILDAGESAAGGRVLVSSDMLLDGVHFDTRSPDAPPAQQIGRKAIACERSSRWRHVRDVMLDCGSYVVV